ncbi:MAG TPA: leucyl aminopeptidase [Abditibacteriaceae bacterium]|jgi:leucyl aminopeptidase
MRFETRNNAPLEVETPCLIVPLFQGAELDGHAAELNEKLNGLVAQIIGEDGFKGTVGDTRVLYTQANVAAARVILLGLGKREKFDLNKWRKAVSKGVRAARSLKKSQVALALPESDFSDEDLAGAASEAAILGLHIYNDFKTDEESQSLTALESLTFLTEAGCGESITRAETIARANLRARAWVNAPSNTKSPDFLANAARVIAQENDLRCEIWDEYEIQSAKMGALYGVGMGSDNPPRFIILEYTPEGTQNDAPIILVGKGMTFDSGGYSIKPSTSMEEMKDDMAGAAVVLAVMSALRDLNFPKRVIGIVPSAENMISGRAQRPGDIVTARNGKTIEVLNTDAEGRLILADALSYASELNPAAILDYATLTGAVRIALGQEAAGIFANEAGQDLQEKTIAAGTKTGEPLWPFPMWDEYKEHVKGTISDLKNLGQERGAGSIAGAVFLENFVGESIPWCHLDIAALSLVKDERFLTQRGATGFGVRLTLELLQDF